jgi:dTDP-4-amino-4,6-dideoxygalactose transaminase
MERRGIEARVFWKSLPEQAAYRDFPRCLTGAAAGLSGTVVSVPASASLSDDDVARVKSALAAWSGTALSLADAQ